MDNNKKVEIFGRLIASNENFLARLNEHLLEIDTALSASIVNKEDYNSDMASFFDTSSELMAYRNQALTMRGRMMKRQTFLKEIRDAAKK